MACGCAGGAAATCALPFAMRCCGVARCGVGGPWPVPSPVRRVALGLAPAVVTNIFCLHRELLQKLKRQSEAISNLHNRMLNLKASSVKSVEPPTSELRDRVSLCPAVSRVRFMVVYVFQLSHFLVWAWGRRKNGKT